MRKSILLALAISTISHAAVQIRVEADSGRKPISPYIYGKNDGVYHNTSESALTILRVAGLLFSFQTAIGSE